MTRGAYSSQGQKVGSVATLDDIVARLDAMNAAICKDFAKGDVGAAVAGFYAEDVRYLTPELTLLRGREEVVAFLTAFREQFRAVELKVVETILPAHEQVDVLQFVNVTALPASGEEATTLHYVASFRRQGSGWICHMEVPAPGAIVTTG